MPVVLPTPDEMRHLNWHHRDRAILTARQLLRSYGAVVSADCTADGLRTSAEARRRADVEWGERVRDEARRLTNQN